MFIDQGGDDPWGKQWTYKCRTFLLALQWLIHNICITQTIKCQPHRESHRDLQQGPHSPWWCLQHHPFLFLLASCFIFHHLLLLPDNSVVPQLCHSALPFTLTFQAQISLSPTLSINICLWVCLSPPHPPSPAHFWREQGNVPSPVDVNTHSRLEVLQLQQLTDQGFYGHTGIIEDICTVHSIHSLCCQTHLFAEKLNWIVSSVRF